MENWEREASKKLQAPPHCKNMTEINFVATKFVQDGLQTLIAESSAVLLQKRVAWSLSSVSKTIFVANVTV